MRDGSAAVAYAGIGRAHMGWKKAQGILCAFAFATLIAGTNATTPMLPLYRQELGFSPLMLTLTFVSYVSVLVIVLLILANPRFARHAAALVCLSLATAIGADILIGMATEWGILTGRAMAGIAGGLATGSASALVVIAFGDRGRSISATGNLAGAVGGTAFSQTCVALLGNTAMHWTFLLHAFVCTVLLMLLLVVLRRRTSMNSAALVTHAGVALGGIWRKLWISGFVTITGCISWMILSSAIVLLPSLFAETGLSLLRQYGLIALLVSSAGAQLLSPYLTRRFPSLSGTFAMAAGMILVLIGVEILSTTTVAIGMVLIGTGNGLSYRLSLLVLVKGENPARQGALASAYAAATYGAAATWVLLAGLAGNLFGLHTAVFAVFACLALTVIAIGRRAPRLRDICSDRGNR